jgi:sortase (surface protein transpeptidase)
MHKYPAARRPRLGFGAAAVAAALACAGAGALAYALTTAPTPPPQPTKAQAGTLSVHAKASAPQPLALPASKPVSLRIPSIGVDAPVDMLGLNSDGAVQVPAQPMHAGWYTDSASPGQLGAAVLLGHVDFYTTGPAVFYSLGSLNPGAAITVVRQDGTGATFTVTAVREYPKSDFPTAEVYYAPGDSAQLRLVTCGSWDPDMHAYTGNTVAFATLTSVTLPGSASPRADAPPPRAVTHPRPQ